MEHPPSPSATYLRSLDDLDKITFVNGVAEVDVPIELIDALPLVGAERPETERLHQLIRCIRSEGYGGGPRIAIRSTAADVGMW